MSFQYGNKLERGNPTLYPFAVSQIDDIISYLKQ